MNTPKATVVLTGITYLLFLALFLAVHHQKIGYIIGLGEKFCPGRDYVYNIPVIKNSDGYDGQFYYRLALDPFCTDSTIPIKIDGPAYRQQRILFPLLAKALTFWDPRLVPYVFFAINFISILVISFLIALLAQTVNRSPLWGYIAVLYPGFIFSLFHGLSEPFMVLWIVAALHAFRKNKPWIGCLSLCLAVLARETAAIVPMGIGVIWIYYHTVHCKEQNTAIRKQGYLIAGIPILTLIAWQIFLSAFWGYLPSSQGCAFKDSTTGHFQIPLAALIQKSMESVGVSRGDINFFDSVSILVFLFTVAVAFSKIKNSSADLISKFSFLGYAGMALFYSYCIWEYHGGYFRALTELYIFSFIIILQVRNLWLLRLQGIAWTGLSLLMIRDLGFFNLWK